MYWNVFNVSALISPDGKVTDSSVGDSEVNVDHMLIN